MRICTVKLPDELFDWAHVTAKAQDRSVSSLVRQALISLMPQIPPAASIQPTESPAPAGELRGTSGVQGAPLAAIEAPAAVTAGPSGTAAARLGGGAAADFSDPAAASFSMLQQSATKENQ